ncbi:MAG: 4-hydroxyphenylacetate 3-hydroxylase N-terminal domain-containing protein [Candidatus Binatus sp.]|uniref:4-hydroxyphenylacetate 3-hydroxylase family protein n=1 Tax=Candidatus Binatus sp. TaxID=2811406 RepID=UPI0027160BA6|nr:4-hydroxyphenylacetate 3-hydroxylase N-terminal domain-containing protein [Candidatus Binatus sp.]MDO8431573.1 4-hydroxyphenylacetate 3-hydroxylase N-terminal domain-containing protein [Candidatus Binatus sp.]
MGARTGKEFLAGLAKPRDIWVGNDKVEHVASHPAFAGAAATLAQIFDLQHAAREVCLMPDPETGEPINMSHMIPRSKADLDRRHRCLQTIAEFTVGLMGRTPDYMNVTYAGFAGRADEWAMNGNENGAANLVAYQKFLARHDISLTHTIVQPTIDKALGDAPAAGNDVALHKIADTAHGIVVRGARILATLAPFADEIAVYPAMPLPEGADAYALSFCIPMGTPGLKFLCRDSCSLKSSHFDHPLSSRFDEQDAFVIFDDVEVPRDRVFINANRDAYNTVMTTGWYPNVMQQTMIRAQTKLEFAWGLASRMTEVINDASPAAKQMLGEIWTYAELTRGAIRAAEADAFEYGSGVWFPNGGPLAALRAILPTWFPRVGEIITLLGSHNLLAAPTEAQLRDPSLRPLIDRYLRGAKDIRSDERARIFRLAWDFVGSALASRNELYERFYLASGARNYLLANAIASKDRARQLVDGILNEHRGAPAEQSDERHQKLNLVIESLR